MKYPHELPEMTGDILNLLVLSDECTLWWSKTEQHQIHQQPIMFCVCKGRSIQKAVCPLAAKCSGLQVCSQRGVQTFSSLHLTTTCSLSCSRILKISVYQRVTTDGYGSGLPTINPNLTQRRIFSKTVIMWCREIWVLREGKHQGLPLK